MRDGTIELEIYEGRGGPRRTDGVRPDFANEGLCAWMYGGDGTTNFTVGQTIPHPDDLGKLCPWLVDSVTGEIRALELVGRSPGAITERPMKKTLLQTVSQQSLGGVSIPPPLELL